MINYWLIQRALSPFWSFKKNKKLSHIMCSSFINFVAPGEHWYQGKLEFMLSQRGKPLLVHDGHTFGIQYVRKDKKYWQCNLSRKFNCKARVTTTDTGEIIVTNNEHCHTEIRQHLRKDYQRNKVMMNALLNLSNNHFADLQRQQHQQQQHHRLTALMGPHAVALTQTSQIEEVVKNLHDLAKANEEVSERNNLHQQMQLDVKHDIEEGPLDCGIKHTASIGPEDVPRNFITNNTATNNDNNDYKSDEWKCKNERNNLQ